MEDIPPSYHSINPTVLELLPPYLDTPSLINLCLVSRSYYVAFIQHLWGSPASHFVPLTGNVRSTQITGFHNDTVYIALTRFKRTLRKARLSTRLLCHTLHLPPAVSEIYGGPNATWLKEILDWLPALQSLSVAGLPFFDHHSLVSVDRTRQLSVPPTGEHSFVSYPLKLLLASKEPNATSMGLSLILPHFPSLIYLDLSYTTPARDLNVLSCLSSLQDLQVLKLKGVGLKDQEAEILANAIGLRVRLLDLSENLLTDMAIRSLLQACFLLPSTPAQTTNGGIHRNGTISRSDYSRRHLESWPVGMAPSPDFLSLDIIRSANLDTNLLVQLTNPLTGRLAFEDLPHNGITHLYISGNLGVSVEGVRSLLDLGRLHVLDAGDIGTLTAVDLKVLSAKNGSSRSRTKSLVSAGKSVRRLRKTRQSPPSSLNSIDLDSDNWIQDDDEEVMSFPGAEKLATVLREKAGKNLTYLRIDHAVVSKGHNSLKDLQGKEKKTNEELELPGSAPMAAELPQEGSTFVEAPASKYFPVEMPSDRMVFELDSTPAQPRVELPGDIIHFAISPPIGDAPTSSERDTSESTNSAIRGEGAFAPEAVKTLEDIPHEAIEDEIILDATGSGRRKTSVEVVHSPTFSQSPRAIQEFTNIAASIRNGNSTFRPLAPPASKILISRTAQIEKLLSLRPQPPHSRLHPCALPNLRTLVLTNVPTKIPSSSGATYEALKDFIAACAAEAHLALLKSRTDYSLPPGRARYDAEQEHARSLFALGTIVLEMCPEQENVPQRDWKHTRQRLNISKSSTGDRDSEALWTASENDFSFFGEEGEEQDECGIYDQDPEKYFPTISFDDKIAVSAEDVAGMSDTWSSSRNTHNSHSPHGSFSGMSPMTPIARSGTLFQSPRDLPLGRNRRSSNEAQRGTFSRTDTPERPSTSNSAFPVMELPGFVPHTLAHRGPAPTSDPTSQPPLKAPEPPSIDIIGELSRWRRERKAAYEQEVRRRQRAGSLDSNADAGSGRGADNEVYVEGHWKGKIEVLRPEKTKNKGRLERTGKVDIYGNYFENGYLYP